MKRTVVLLSSIVCTFAAMSQSEQSDSIFDWHPADPSGLAPADESTDSLAGAVPDAYMPSLAYPRFGEPGALRVNPLATRFVGRAYIPGTAILRQWGSGMVVASGANDSLYGLMGMERGALSFNQQVGALSVSIYGTAVKYGYFRGLSTTYGIGGTVTYQLSPTVGVSVFGEYHTDASGIFQPAMMGYVSVPRFGGYVNWRFHSHWGVKLGVQSYRSMAYAKWDTRPIIMPYYRTSGGAELGIDLGPILYELVRKATGGRWGGYGNPTISPDVFGSPPVAPRN